MITAHAVHPSAGRGRRGTEVQVGIWNVIGVKQSRRTRKELGDVLFAAVDVTPDIIGIVIVHGPGIHGMLPDYNVPKPGCKPFNLVEYRFCHVTRRS